VPYWRTLIPASAAIVVLPVVPNADAHHIMGGVLPSTVWQGLLSGLGHPIIGIDHLAFIMGVGLMAHLVGRVALLPLLFVAGTVLGCLLHIQGYDLPWSELVIAASVVMAAGIVATRAQVSITILSVLFVVAGAFHGYAYGESIIGAERTPLSAYVVGFAVIQYFIAVATGTAVDIIAARASVSETTVMRLAGAGMALVAAFAFVNIALVG
jgi:urease accessory protein